MVDVVLEPYEMAVAVEVGCRRQIEAVAQGRRDLYAAAGDPFGSRNWLTQIEGAAGEMALAKALGRYWSASVNTYRRGGDVGAVQVRTRSQPDYDLIVRTHDRDEDYFVLVTGVMPCFRVVGWIKAAEAKRPEWLRDHGGHGAAYFVPQAALHAMSRQVAA